MVKGLRVARVSGMSMTQSSAPLSRNASPPFTCSIGVNCATIVMLAYMHACERRATGCLSNGRGRDEWGGAGETGACGGDLG